MEVVSRQEIAGDEEKEGSDEENDEQKLARTGNAAPGRDVTRHGAIFYLIRCACAVSAVYKRAQPGRLAFRAAS